MALDNVVDLDFEKRWTAWQKRGLAQERKTRQRLTVALPLLAVVAATVYFLLTR